MFKFVVIVLLVGAVARVQAQQVNNNINNIDEYINQNKQQYAQNIRDYDQRLETFKQTYTAGLQVIPKRLDMLVDSIGQTEKRLNSLEILSQQCVQKYRSKLPNVIITKQQINLCYTTANSQTEYLVVQAFGTRTSLDNYYKYQFEGSLQSCKVQIGDYNTCVMNAVSNANAYTASNRKTFDSQMQTAQIKANANTDTAFQCSYSTQNQATSAIAEINILTDRCLKGLDDCKPCSNQGFSCSAVSRSEIDYNNPLMTNVFYGRYELTDCLLLKIFS
ncbi:uncharacterized protein LOC119606977 [Lucilia sericata]|uniref:uncharacterized protein LOC119606977 n=1 Tax=Lucilia sericata TaxID=13632 RepID=UPI0018A808FA|nr:uncharacterized protein LOC119606977 [Lucilia sericata]